MVFDGYHNHKRDSGKQPVGKQIDIACKSWATSEGKITPLMFKYEDGDGIIRTIGEIQVYTSDGKYYCGRPSIEFICSVVVDGMKREVKLIFFPDSCKWCMRI